MIVIAKDLSCGNLNLILFVIARLSKSRGNLNLILFVIARLSKSRGNLNRLYLKTLIQYR